MFVLSFVEICERDATSQILVRERSGQGARRPFDDGLQALDFRLQCQTPFLSDADPGLRLVFFEHLLDRDIAKAPQKRDVTRKVPGRYFERIPKVGEVSFRHL